LLVKTEQAIINFLSGFCEGVESILGKENEKDLMRMRDPGIENIPFPGFTPLFFYEYEQ
jgi:hypothetical protein